MEGKNLNFGTNPPEDAHIVKKVGPWDIYFSMEENAFYVQTEDYHALPLKLLKSEMLGLLAAVEKLIEDDMQEKRALEVELSVGEDGEE